MIKKIICGIYKITNPNGKIYIGQAKDIDYRWLDYKRLACKKQIKLYGSLNKYGVENHIFEVIEECLELDLNYRERFWQDEFDVLNREKGLNLVLTKCENKKRVLSEDYKDSIRNTLIANSKVKYDPIYQYSLDGILLKIWINRYHIKTETNYAISNIAECYLLSNLTAYGFIWRREETLFEKDFLIKVKNIAGYKNKSILQLSLKGE